MTLLQGSLAYKEWQTNIMYKILDKIQLIYFIIVCDKNESFTVALMIYLTPVFKSLKKKTVYDKVCMRSKVCLILYVHCVSKKFPHLNSL